MIEEQGAETQPAVAVSRGPVTAEMLAKRLGLSRATVSIVLRGDAKRRKISEQTTKRVLDAAKELNYVPNLAARILRRQRTDQIGVLLADVQLDWADRVMAGILSVMDDSPYSPFIALHRFNPDQLRKQATAAFQRRDAAMICFPLPGLEDVYAQFQTQDIPLIFIGDRPPGYEQAHWVIWDAEEAAKTAARHLVQVGCRRIGFLGMDYPMVMSQSRFAAYKAVLEEAGLPFNPDWVSLPSTTSDLAHVVDIGLKKIFSGDGPFPDGLFVLNDGMAFSVLDKLPTYGIRVPKDVRVIGMGDMPMARHRAINLSTVREPQFEMGKAAAEVAMRLANSNSSAPLPFVQQLIPCNELNIRGSSWMG